MVPHKLSLTNSVDVGKIEIFTGGTVLTWLELVLSCESSIIGSDEFFDHLQVLPSSLEMYQVQ